MTAGRPAVATNVAAAVGTLCLVQFVDVLGVTVVVTTLPDMLRGVGSPPSAGALVATGYAMFFGGLLMFGARFGDRVGHRRAILISLGVFAVGSVLAAVATSIVVLTGARCLQGAAAAVAVPSALRLLTSVATSDVARARAVSAWSASGAAAGASGFVLGGVVGDLASWRWVFWGLLVVAGALAVAMLRAVPPDGHGDPSLPLNPVSSTLLTGAVMAVVVGTTLVADSDHRWVGIALLAVSVVLAGALWWLDRRSSAPLLPSRLLRQPNIRRGSTASWLNTATTSSAATLVTLYVQDTLGRSPLAAAATLLPFSLAVIGGAALAPAALRRARRERVVAAGLLIIAIAIACLIAAAAHSVGIGACMAGAGVGIGLSSVAATSLGTDVVEQDRAAASGLINTASQLGTAIGVAVILLIAAVTTGTPARDTSAPTIAWAIAAIATAAGAAAFIALRRSDVETRQAAPTR
jgi:MFS family permease